MGNVTCWLTPRGRRAAPSRGQWRSYGSASRIGAELTAQELVEKRAGALGILDLGVVTDVVECVDLIGRNALLDPLRHVCAGHGGELAPDEAAGPVRPLQGAGPALGVQPAVVDVADQPMVDARSAAPLDAQPVLVQLGLARQAVRGEHLPEAPGERALVDH